MFNLFRILEMSYLEELLPEFRKGAKIRQEYRGKNYFIQLKDGLILDSYGSPYKFTSIDLLEDKWEFYQDPIDWQYIIDNKCLSWFWDIYGEDLKNLGTVDCITEKGKFKKHDLTCWSNCRPVRRDEITFYEDKE